MADWYYRIAKQVVGPLSAEQLKALADSGRLAPTDPVARSKSGPWVLAARVKGLFEAAFVADEPAAPTAQPAEPAQAAWPEPPGQAFDLPPVPQPPVVIPKKTAAMPSPPQPGLEPSAGASPSAVPGPPVGFAIQAEQVGAAQRLQKKKKFRKPKEPLTKKQKNALLVKWLAIAIAAGIVVLISIPFIRRLIPASPETAPVKMPVAADIDLAATGDRLEDVFGAASQAVSRGAATPARKAAQGSTDGGAADRVEGSAPDSGGAVEAKPVRVVLDRPLMTSGDGRTARAANRFLLVELELRTKAPGVSARFHGWLSCAKEVLLTDDKGVKYETRTPQNFRGMFVEGQCRETTFLTFDKPATDVVVFAWPEAQAPPLPSASDESALKLRLPKSAYGEEGELRFAIPLSEIDVTEEALEVPQEKLETPQGPTSEHVPEDNGGPIPIPGLQK